MRKSTLISLSAAAALAFFGFGHFAEAEAATPTTGQTTVTGTLTAMSGTTVPATLTMTSGATTYTISVSATTKIIRRYDGGSNLGEFVIGDTLQVKGVLSNDAANTITASKVKDWSIQRVGGTFKGVVVSTSCAVKTFIIKPDDRAQQTVYFTDTTKFTRGGEKSSCVGLSIGERLKVIGLWRKASNRIDADRVIVDLKTITGTITNITLTNGGLPATLTVARKAEVKSSMMWMQSALATVDWTINVTSNTKIFRNYMGVATIEELAVGDKIEVRGILSTGNTITANVLRDLSITIKNKDLEGTVKSIDTTASTLVLRVSGKKYGDITVTTSTSTKYWNEHTAKVFADIKVGDKLKVLGVYNSTTKTIAGSRIYWHD